MDQSNWTKYGLMALAGLGFVAIVGVALSLGGDLEGEDWVVEELTIDGTSAAPLAGTELTALFEDGSVGGNAGCNSFFAEYQVDGDSIVIGPAGSTMAFCSAPEGTMDQELAYLTLLGMADSFSRDGDQLTLSSDGTVVLRFGVANAE